MSKIVKSVAILGVVAAATASGIWFSQWWHNKQQPLMPTNIDAVVLPQARAISDFSLTAADGQPFTLAKLKGKWSFVFFGYTHCPDVCPTTLAMLNTVAHTLQKQDGSLKDVQFVFISVDPDRDTPENLGKFVTYFNKAFIGTTGKKAQIDQLTKQLGAMYSISKDPKKHEYTVNHSATIDLIQPDGKLRALFSPPHVPGKIVKAFDIIRARY